MLITDKDFDRQYDHNLNCLWVIRVREPNVIFLKFSHFRIEYAENCLNDYVEVNGEIYCEAFISAVSIFCGSMTYQYVIEPQRFDTADIKSFKVYFSWRNLIWRS